MSFIRVPTGLLEANITPSQFKLCAFIISNSVYNTDTKQNACFWGYEQIALKFSGKKSAKSSIIKQINDLIDKKILIIYKRGGNKSAGIAFNQDFDYGSSQNNEGCLNSTDRCLNSTDRCLNSTPHKDIRFKNIYLKNINGEGCLNSTDEKNKIQSKNVATADAAAVRSVPEAGQVRQESAKGSAGVEIEPQITDFILFDEFFEEFRDQTAFYQVGKVDDFYFIRPYKAFLDIFEEKFKAAAQWFEARGLVLQMVRHGSHFANEIIFEPKKTA